MGADSNQLQNAVSRSLSGTIDVWTIDPMGKQTPVATRWLRLTQDAALEELARKLMLPSLPPLPISPAR